MESQELYCMKCNSCGFLTLQAQSNCFSCSKMNWTKIKLTGLGTIYSFSKINVGFGKMTNKTPYYLTMIQLDEGLTLLAILEQFDSDRINFGNKVKFTNLTEDNIYKFKIVA